MQTNTNPSVVMIAVLLLWCFSQQLAAEEPELEPGLHLYDGSQPLDEDQFPVPFVVDWNEDGMKDLLVGQYTHGYIRLYLNQGTDLNPLFNGYTLVRSAGVPITTSYG